MHPNNEEDNRKDTRLWQDKSLKPFDCGDDDLNGFLIDDAMFYRQQMLANTFVLEDDEQTLAYYSLLNDKISNTTVPMYYDLKQLK